MRRAAIAVLLAACGAPAKPAAPIENTDHGRDVAPAPAPAACDQYAAEIDQVGGCVPPQIRADAMRRLDDATRQAARASQLEQAGVIDAADADAERASAEAACSDGHMQLMAADTRCNDL